MLFHQDMKEQMTHAANLFIQEILIEWIAENDRQIKVVLQEEQKKE